MTDGGEKYSKSKLVFVLKYISDFVRSELDADSLEAVLKMSKMRVTRKKRKPTAGHTVKKRSYGKPISFNNHNKSSWFVRKPKHVRRSSSFQKERSQGFYESSRSQSFSFVDSTLHTMRLFTTTHRWSDAAAVMPGLLELLTTYPLLVWKVGYEILLNHRETSSDRITHFANKIVRSCRSHRSNVVLDHLTYLITSGDYVEAKRFAQTNPHSLRTQKTKPTKIEDSYEKGFKALVEFFLWLAKKSSLEENENIPDNQLVVGEITWELSVHLERSCDGFDAALKCKGNLDVFIDKYLQLLEGTNNWEKANDVLKTYMTTNKHHPSSFAFYDDFLKRRRRHEGTEEAVDGDLRKSTLKKLVKKNPSDARVMDLFHLYSETDFKSRFNLLANTVDLPGWRNNIQVWFNLASLITDEVPRHADMNISGAIRRHTLRKFVKDRASYWSLFHFNVSDVGVNTLAGINLNISKAIVAATIYGKKNPFVKAVNAALVEKHLNEDQGHLSEALMSIPSVNTRRRHRTTSRTAVVTSLPGLKKAKKTKNKSKKTERGSLSSQLQSPGPSADNAQSSKRRRHAEPPPSSMPTTCEVASAHSFSLKEAVVVLERLQSPNFDDQTSSHPENKRKKKKQPEGM